MTVARAGARRRIGSSRRARSPLIPDGETRAAGESFRRRDGRVHSGGRGSAALLDAGAPRARAAARRARCRLRRRRCGAAWRARPPSKRPWSRGRRCRRENSAASSRRCASTGMASRSWRARPERGRRSRSAPLARRGRTAGLPGPGRRGRAARGERADRAGAGIQSTSVAALLQRSHGGERLPDRCVLVVDEAGMLADAAARGAARPCRACQRQARARRRPPAAAGDRRRRIVRRSRAAGTGGRARRERPPGQRVGARSARSSARRWGGFRARALSWSMDALAIEPSERRDARPARARLAGLGARMRTR